MNHVSPAMSVRPRFGLGLVAALGFVLPGTLLAATGCHRSEVIVKTADGRRLRAEDIDRDPTALLPGGALGIATLDAPSLNQAAIGQKLLELARRHAPMPEAAHFEPGRDLNRLLIGVYSMQGVDFAGIATGSFDKSAIERTADGTQTTPLGIPVVRSTYAEHTLYTGGNVGFVVLTEHTILFGNETGIRRVLDRLARGRIAREIPVWAGDLMERRDTPFTLAMDFGADPISASVREQLPFMGALSRVRLVGNFASPGLNLAGTAVYRDDPAAVTGAAQLNEIQTLVRRWSWLTAIVGIPQPVHRVQAAARGPEVDFVVGLDAIAMAKILDQASTMLAAAGSGG
ncbi:MAG: hypothetical protein JW751_31920 [Polyangiaceae bacterium]|nr:hypothetical protein [Polyangiaceae bacterium]